MISVWNLQFQTVLLRSWSLCSGIEELKHGFDYTTEVVRAVPGVSVLGCHACSWPWSVFLVRVLRVGFCVPVRVGCWSVPCWAVRVELACSILRVGACWCVLGPRVRACRVACWPRVGCVLAACWLRVGRVVCNCCRPGPTFFLKKPLVPGSFAAWGRTFLRNPTFF